MGSSKRVLSGSLTKGSTAVPLGSQETSVSFDVFRQGINLRDSKDLVSGLQRKIRINSGLKRTFKGRDTNETIFNDTFSPIILSGSSAEISSPAVAGRTSYRIVHEMEQRDLGQFELYTTPGPFQETVNPDNAVHVINVLDRGRDLPASLVDHSSLSAMDGKMDPFRVRRRIDRSTIDHPYSAFGTKGSMQQIEDAFLRSSEIEDRKINPGDNFIEINYYFDAPENFGNVLIPSVFNVNIERIKPYNDSFGNDVEFWMNKNSTIDKSPISKNDINWAGQHDMSSVLLTGSFNVDDKRENFDKMSIGGFDYDGKTDSIAFGGLLK